MSANVLLDVRKRYRREQDKARRQIASCVATDAPSAEEQFVSYAFLEELAAPRKRGWAFDNAEDNDGVYCIAAPLLNAAGEATGAISVSGVSSQIKLANLNEVAAAVVSTANRIAADYRH